MRIVAVPNTVEEWCILQAMKLAFNRDVRKSIADELKKVSTLGGIGLGVLGYSMTDPWIMLGAFVW